MATTSKNARKVKNVNEAQLVAFILCREQTDQLLPCHRTLCPWEVLRANGVQDVVDSRTPSHRNSECSANCSRAATVTHMALASGMLRRMSQICVWLVLDDLLREDPSGSHDLLVWGSLHDVVQLLLGQKTL